MILSPKGSLQMCRQGEQKIPVGGTTGGLEEVAWSQVNAAQGVSRWYQPPGYSTGDAALTSTVPHFCQTQVMNGWFDAAKTEVDGGSGCPKEYNLAQIKHLQMNEMEQHYAQCPWQWLPQGALNILWSHVKHSCLVLIFCNPYTKSWQSYCTLPSSYGRQILSFFFVSFSAASDKKMEAFLKVQFRRAGEVSLLWESQIVSNWRWFEWKR